MSDRFKRKRVLVTGAGIGIGYEICREFAEEGAVVGLNSRSEKSTQEAVEKIQSAHPETTIFPYAGDIGNIPVIQSQIDRFAEEQGGIDIFVANAGITVFEPFLDIKVSDLQHVIQVNLVGTFCSVQSAARHMVAQGRGGRIILMSSVCGIQSHLNTSAYGATKAAIRHLAISLSEELGPHGITVNVVAPGATMTERTMADAQYVEGWSDVAPTKTVGKVEDVAYTTLFLADDRASHISGEIIMVDGGWTITSPLPTYLKDEING